MGRPPSVFELSLTRVAGAQVPCDGGLCGPGNSQLHGGDQEAVRYPIKLSTGTLSRENYQLNERAHDVVQGHVGRFAHSFLERQRRPGLLLGRGGCQQLPKQSEKTVLLSHLYI